MTTKLKGFEVLNRLLPQKQKYINYCRENSIKVGNLFEVGNFLENWDPSNWESYNLESLGLEKLNKDNTKIVTKDQRKVFSPSILLNNTNLETHFEKHGFEFDNLKTVSEYEAKISEFIEAFSEDLKPNQIIFPLFDRNKSTNEEQLKLYIQDLITQDVLILVRDENQGAWYFTSFYNKKITKMTGEKYFVESIAFYENFLKSALYKNTETLSMIEENLFRTKAAYNSFKIQNSIKAVRDASQDFSPN